jgi:hypothetical protein
VVVVEIESQPSELVSRIVYLAQQSPGHFIAQLTARMVVLVKETARRACHPCSESGALGERKAASDSVAG